MPTTRAHQAVGSWNLALKFPPQSVWEDLLEYGHIVIVPRGSGGSLANSVYTGVLLTRSRSDKGWQIGGKGIDYWLGDGVRYGEVFEPPLADGVNSFDAEVFATVITALLPQSVHIGSPGIVSTGLTAYYYNDHVWDTPLNAIRYVADAYSAVHDTEVEYKLDETGGFSIGQKGYIYNTSPSVFIVRRKSDSPGQTSYGGKRFTESIDATEYATRVVLQGQGAGFTLRLGEADLADIGESAKYKDLEGNDVIRVKLVSEAETPMYGEPDETQPDKFMPEYRAELHLKESQKIQGRVTLRQADWDLDDLGTFEVGDYVWVYNDDDPAWRDSGNPQSYDGMTVYPVKRRVFKHTRPIHSGEYDVYYRNASGGFQNITQYIVDEDPMSASLEVGSAERKLAYDPDLLRKTYIDRATHNPDVANPPGAVDETDGSITKPAAPVWENTPWGYNSWVDQNGLRKVAVLVDWQEPLNTNGTVITDGDRYVLEYKRSVDTEWNPGLIIPWIDSERLVTPLDSTPPLGWTWQFRVQAVDTWGNASAWSTVESIATIDNVPPSQPSQPTLTALPLFVMVEHDGTKQGGGDMEDDVKVYRVYASTTSGFTPDDDTNKVLDMWTSRGQITTDYFESGNFGPDGTTIYVKMIAEDNVGNRSDASAQTSITSTAITETNITPLGITTPTLAANAVTASKLATIQVEVAKEIRSTGFSEGSQGWRIKGDGSAEFNDVIIRGSLLNIPSGTSFPSSPEEGEFFNRTDQKIVYRYSSVDGWVPLDYVSSGYRVANSIISNAHITDLSATKITTGTLNVSINLTSGGYFYSPSNVASNRIQIHGGNAQINLYTTETSSGTAARLQFYSNGVLTGFIKPVWVGGTSERLLWFDGPQRGIFNNTVGQYTIYATGRLNGTSGLNSLVNSAILLMTNGVYDTPVNIFHRSNIPDQGTHVLIENYINLNGNEYHLKMITRDWDRVTVPVVDQTNFAFRADGYAAAYGTNKAWATPSDIRNKRLMKPLTGRDAYLRLRKIDYITYLDKDDPNDRMAKRVGASAQSVKKAFPRSVFKGEGDFLTMTEREATWANSSAIVSMYEEIEALKAEIKKLKKG